MWPNPRSNPVSLVGRLHTVRGRGWSWHPPFHNSWVAQISSVNILVWHGFKAIHSLLPCLPRLASYVSGSPVVPFTQALPMRFSHHMVQVVFTSIPCLLGFPSGRPTAGMCTWHFPLHLLLCSDGLLFFKSEFCPFPQSPAVVKPDGPLIPCCWGWLSPHTLHQGRRVQADSQHRFTLS